MKSGKIGEGIQSLINSEFLGFETGNVISLEELNLYRRKYLAFLIIEERGELAKKDQDVMAAIQSNSNLSENIQNKIEGNLSFGDKLADHITKFGGSWTFIIFFFSFILI